MATPYPKISTSRNADLPDSGRMLSVFILWFLLGFLIAVLGFLTNSLLIFQLTGLLCMLILLVIAKTMHTDNTDAGTAIARVFATAALGIGCGIGPALPTAIELWEMILWLMDTEKFLEIVFQAQNWAGMSLP